MTRKKRSSLSAFILIVLLTILIAVGGIFGINFGDYRTVTFNESIIKGLDLMGGTSVLLEVQADELPANTLENVRELINLRVNSTGATDATITTEGTKRIRVDIPGEYQTREIVENLSKTGLLTFKDEAGNVVLEGKDIERADAVMDEYGKYEVALKMKPEGIAKFAEATRINVGKTISINMDEEMLSDPRVNSEISNGEARITGQKDKKEAQMLAAMINNGALPYPVKAVSVKNVGATLGTSVLPAVGIAAALGILAIFIIMIYFYRIPGILASLALIIFALGLLMVTVWLKISMSLAGIAGFLLSVGMAVDANILIFERIKEEINAGLQIKKAIATGFSEAMSSIVDANITTLISGFILYYVGSGTVRGFALNLVLGVILSMFTAIVVTRVLVNLAYNIGWLSTPKAFGVTGKEEFSFKFPFYERRNIFFILSAVVIGIGLIVGIVKGPNMGIDFAGGTQVTLDFGSVPFSKADTDEIVHKYDPSAFTQVTDGNIYEIRSQNLDTVEFDPLLTELKTKYGEGEDFVNSMDEIGAAIGTEQTRKAVMASVLSVLAILAYVAVRFNFTLGVGAIVALVHDVLFTLSMYFLLRVPINSPFIAAILTIIGYSINDTVVIFDRIRENLKLKNRNNLEEVTDLSISQTMVRTINTSLTVFVILILMYFLVPQIRDFTLPLLLGTISGVYSTVFIASPIYVMLEKRFGKKKMGEAVTTETVTSKTVPASTLKKSGSEVSSAEAAVTERPSEKRERDGKKEKTYSNRYKKKEKAPVRTTDRFSYKKDDISQSDSRVHIVEIPSDENNTLSQDNAPEAGTSEE